MRTLFLAAVLLAQACTGRPPPDAHALVEEAAGKIERHAYYADRVDWKQALAQAKLQVRDPQAFDEAHSAISGMLRQLRDGHSFLLRPDRTKAIFENKAVDDIAIDTRDLGDVFVVAVPTFVGTQAVREQEYSTRLHSAFERNGNPPRCGWVVDLREDRGGNMFPMLAGLAPLIGTGDLGKFVDRSGREKPWPVRRIYVDARMDISAFEAPDLRSARVAVITGRNTMSSGEAVAIAFRGRANTRSFGEPTAGKSTGNEGFELGDGSMMLITTVLMADRNGVRFGRPIEPDESADARIGKGIEDDAALASAVRWLRAGCGGK